MSDFFKLVQKLNDIEENRETSVVVESAPSTKPVEIAETANLLSKFNAISAENPYQPVVVEAEEVEELGQIQIFRFRNPAGLESMGRNLYRENQASGEGTAGIPNENGYGALNQGALEKSNVKVIEEMVNMIIAQRAFEVNSKAVQTADEMMNMTNNLRR